MKNRCRMAISIGSKPHLGKRSVAGYMSVRRKADAATIQKVGAIYRQFVETPRQSSGSPAVPVVAGGEGMAAKIRDLSMGMKLNLIFSSWSLPCWPQGSSPRRSRAYARGCGRGGSIGSVPVRLLAEISANLWTVKCRYLPPALPPEVRQPLRVRPQ